MNKLLESALSYARRGWPVFPCQPRGKRPLTSRGFKDAATDEGVIRGWWAKWPDANIGVPTGSASGFVVVDLDGGEGIESLAKILNSHELVQTVISLTGGGGKHLLFLAPDPPLRNTQGALGRGVDTRGDGGYIIAPPSIHASGDAYRWLPRHGPDDTPLAILPDRLRPQPNRVRRQLSAHHSERPDVESQRRLQRASAYLSAMDPAIEGCGGHSKLFAAATVLVNGFCLEPGEAIAMLWDEYNPRCIPPWDPAIPAERRDFERKVKQARDTPHDRPVGWLLDEESDAAVEHGAEVASRLLAGRDRSRPELTAVVTRVDQAAAREFPKHLLEPPGYVGELCAWINRTSYKPQPVFALANALAFFGAVLGRKVAGYRGLRTNIYCVGVGQSGYGKDHSQSSINALC